MICNKNVACTIGGKTARACDCCVIKRAKLYCAADDAFLCQSCDSTIHSANPLARRHERVRLKTASFKSLNNIEPSWHRGFKRKPRTRRQGKPVSNSTIIVPFVPELVSDEVSVEDNEEEEEEEQKLVYSVPVFDPLAVGLCDSTDVTPIESKDVVESVIGFPPSDLDLADFAADVESLLGRGLENESFRIEELGLVDCKEEMDCLKRGKSEIEGEYKNKQEIEEGGFDTEIDMAKGPPFELSFEYDSAACGEEEDKEDDESEKETKKKERKKIVLSLDYDAVISSWAAQGCPWTNGNRPEIDLENECWPDWIMGNWGVQGFGGKGGLYPLMAAGGGGGGREARVSRYREKRRTRLFSKKIRYEVRKINAEKRPRMKGRFVKRSTFVASSLH